jgi:hypothetical protein
MITATAITAITSTRTTDHGDENRNSLDSFVANDVRSGPGIVIAASSVVLNCML